MSYFFKYFGLAEVIEIRSAFVDFLDNSGVTLHVGNLSSNLKLRKKMYDFFSTEVFRDIYLTLGDKLRLEFGFSKQDFLLQSMPTARIFRPGDHGTSLHNDYWYGHGKSYRTAWLPLYGGDISGATFDVVSNEKENQRIIDLVSNNPQLLKSVDSIDVDTFQVLPKKNELAVFSSETIHLSRKNTSASERLSFDFRFGDKNDPTTTKNINTFISFSKSMGIDKANTKYKNNFLKYIVGGKSMDTTSQHIIIEGVSTNNLIMICGQEAEIERYGYPMLEMHIEKISNRKSLFDGVVIASKELLSKRELDLIMSFETPVFFAAENEWVNKDLIRYV